MLHHPALSLYNKKLTRLVLQKKGEKGKGKKKRLLFNKEAWYCF